MFVRLGLVSFGAVNLAEMQRQLVVLRGWMSPETFVNGYALGQLVPGPNVLAIYFYGYTHLGVLGGVMALLGFFLPTAALVTGVSLFWRAHADHPWVQSVRNALLPFGAGVLLSVILVLSRDTFHTPLSFLLGAAAVVAIVRFRVNPTVVVLVGAGLGALLLR